jgi:hypothetical protein
LPRVSRRPDSPDVAELSARQHHAELERGPALQPDERSPYLLSSQTARLSKRPSTRDSTSALGEGDRQRPRPQAAAGGVTHALADERFARKGSRRRDRAGRARWRRFARWPNPVRSSALPRPQLSRRGGRTAASAPRCTSGVGGADGNRRATASLRHRPVPRSPERSSGLGRPRDRNVRRAIAGVVEPLATPLPRQQPSRLARRTTGSPRLSGSHAARGRRHSRAIAFPMASAGPHRPRGQKRSSRLGHARDRNRGMRSFRASKPDDSHCQTRRLSGR